MASPVVVGYKTAVVDGREHRVTVYAPVVKRHVYRARLRSQATRKDMLELLASMQAQLDAMGVRG
jgi:hypothetical protein